MSPSPRDEPAARRLAPRLPRPVRALAAPAALALAAWTGLGAWLWSRQAALIFHPTRFVATTPADVELDFEPVTLETADGERLAAWWIPRAGARGTLLLCHGNAGNIGHRVEMAALFHALDLHVLLFDYRGYGDSTGTPDEPGLAEDARAAWRHVVAERGVAPGRVVLYGRSLGGAVAAELAASLGADEAPAGLVLDSAFTSVPDVAAALYPWLPARRLARFEFGTAAALAAYDGPTLVLHGQGDRMIDPAHAPRLVAAAAGPATFAALPGGHNAGVAERSPAWRDALGAWLDETLGPPRDAR